MVACDSATEALRTLHEREVDAVFLDIQMPGLDRARAGPGAQAVPDARRRSSSSPPTRRTRSTPSSCARSTTCSSRSARSGWPRRSGRVIEGGDRAPAPVEDVQIPVELGGVTRFVDRSRRDPRRGARRLRPAAHRRGQPPDPGPAHHARGGVGRRRLRPHPPLAAGRARARHRGADGVGPLHGRGRSARCRHRPGGQPPAHPRAARAARQAERRHERRRGTGPGPGHRPAAPHATRRAPAPATSTRRPRSAASTSAACCASSSRWRSASSACSP